MPDIPCDQPHCNVTSKTRQNADVHLTLHMPPSLLCPQTGCHRSMHNPKELKKHSEVPHSPCGEIGCTWIGTKGDKREHLLTHPDIFDTLVDCPHKGCFMLIDPKTKQGNNHKHKNMPHIKCPEPGCAAVLAKDNLTQHLLKGGPHFASLKEVKKWRSIIKAKQAGSGFLGEGWGWDVRADFILWKNTVTDPIPNMYRYLSDSMGDHRSEWNKMAQARGIGSLSEIAKGCLMTLPSVLSYPRLDSLPCPAGLRNDPNPWYTIPAQPLVRSKPLSTTSNTSTVSAADWDYSIDPQSYNLMGSLSSYETIADSFCVLMAISRKHLAQIMSRQHPGCLVQQAFAFAIARLNTHHSRLFAPIHTFLAHSTRFPHTTSESLLSPGIISSWWNLIDPSSDSLKSERIALKALMDILEVNKVELVWLFTSPLPKTARGTDIERRRLLGFRMIFVVGVRWRMLPDKHDIRWCSPLSTGKANGSVTDMNNGGDDSSPFRDSHLADLFDEPVYQISFESEQERSALLHACSTALDLPIDQLKGVDLLDPIHQPAHPILYDNLFGFLLRRSRATGTISCPLPPPIKLSFKKVNTFLRSLEERRIGDRILRESEYVVIEFYWMVFGDVRIVSKVMLQQIPFYSAHEIAQFWRYHTKYFSTLSRDPDDVRRFAEEYGLADVYQSILSDQTLVDLMAEVGLNQESELESE